MGGMPDDPFLPGEDNLIDALNEGGTLWGAIYEQPFANVVEAIGALSKNDLRLMVLERIHREKQLDDPDWQRGEE
jgi:hypothetical protein